MSDMFDHECDAMESRDEAYAFPNRQLGKSRTFVPNPLHFHMEITYGVIETETDAAYLMDGRWIPKKICRHVDTENKSMWVHQNTFESILETPKVGASEEIPF